MAEQRNSDDEPGQVPDFHDDVEYYLPDFINSLPGQLETGSPHSDSQSSFHNNPDSPQKYPETGQAFPEGFVSITGQDSRNSDRSSSSSEEAIRNHYMTVPVRPISRSRTHTDRSQHIKKSGRTVFQEFTTHPGEHRPSKRSNEYANIRVYLHLLKALSVFNQLRQNPDQDHLFKQFDEEQWNVLLQFIRDNYDEILQNFIVPKIQIGYPWINRDNRFETYNGAFIQESRSRPIIREFGQKFLDMIFVDQENHQYENLKEFFELSCCQTPGHEERCIDKWKQLRDFLFQSLKFDADNAAEPPQNVAAPAQNKLTEQQINGAVHFANTGNVNYASPDRIDIQARNIGPVNYPITPPMVPAKPDSNEITTYDQTKNVDVTSPDFKDSEPESDRGLDLITQPIIPIGNEVTSQDPNTENVDGTLPEPKNDIENVDAWPGPD